MLARFWGTRGSTATPGPRTARYGGNTSCVEIEIPDGDPIILDCGTGMRPLGSSLLNAKRLPERIHVLIGHTHWDHIQGFPFFTPASSSDIELNLYAPALMLRSLEQALSNQMQYAFFPVRLRDLACRLRFIELHEGSFQLGDVVVESQYVNHTAPTFAYRIHHAGASIAYVTDHEPFSPVGRPFVHPGDLRHIEFLRGADLLIHDAQYSEGEYQIKRGWGHSTVAYATDIAVAAGVKRLALFHHDPDHDDAWVNAYELRAHRRAAEAGSNLAVFAAMEGMVVDVNVSGSEGPVSPGSALATQPFPGGRVLVATEQPSEAATLAELLTENGMTVETTSLSEMNAAALPDMAVIQSNSDGEALGRLVVDLRARFNNAALPVLVVGEEESANKVFTSPLSPGFDYIPESCEGPMLGTRVRIALERAVYGVPSIAGPPAAEAREPQPTR